MQEFAADETESASHLVSLAGLKLERSAGAGRSVRNDVTVETAEEF